jgi:hypothetical protein
MSISAFKEMRLREALRELVYTSQEDCKLFPEVLVNITGTDIYILRLVVQELLVGIDKSIQHRVNKGLDKPRHSG